MGHCQKTSVLECCSPDDKMEIRKKYESFRTAVGHFSKAAFDVIYRTNEDVHLQARDARGKEEICHTRYRRLRYNSIRGKRGKMRRRSRRREGSAAVSGGAV